MVATVPLRISILDAIGILKVETVRELFGPYESQREAILGESYLEQRVLCDDHRDGRREDSPLCKIPRR